ncbi:endo alpha-1,4 polygalactosaminidase [Leifsonia sp. F6_8S_P_1B]|uniref:Endo alpha-1,4 polygalactosaminidase n=1 Tax=Leifsonia williamsii TaxID=3035919 RepID=A0ABT8K8M9_9MICO|nr:endo alpha-1,4 polygalactosaminidase [Leifsonia williamsii]MDN4613387.1 endo alpha-1,4 polygalactosaminidase [Leifsonia williamsii]
MTGALGGALLGGALVLALAGCSGVPDPASAPASPSAHATPRLPDPSAGFDYQLGGAYPPPTGVQTVARDRTAEPAGAGYDICYVNGFQTQPDASERFAQQHPDLLLQTGDGPLVDPGWPDEYLYDTSTEARRDALAALVGPWIEGCARAGFDAVEIDNFDSYTRSKGALTADDNVALAAAYAAIAHRHGLAIAQKNTADQSERLRGLGYDFAVAESCVVYDECAAYTSVYPVLLDVEYTDELGEGGFSAACAERDERTAMILRDHDLRTPGDTGYAYRACAG